MSAEDAVFTAAVARDEVRKSMARMEYHLGRGPKGVRGVQREVAYLDALGRQAARLGAAAQTGAENVGAKLGLGVRAQRALIQASVGNGARAGRIKSSLLAEFSQDTMDGARQWTYNGIDFSWTWVANASACAACLANHGTEQEGEFTPMHPSCLCYPTPNNQAERAGVRPLSGDEIVQTLLDSNNAEFRRVGRQIAAGRITVGEAARAAERQSRKGLRAWRAAKRDMGARVEAGVIQTADEALQAQEAVATGRAKINDRGIVVPDEAGERAYQEALAARGTYRYDADTVRQVLVHGDETRALLGELYLEQGPFANAPAALKNLARQEFEAGYDKMVRIFGDDVLFEGQPTFRHLQALADMAKYDDELLLAVRRAGVRIHFVEGGVSNGDHLQRFATRNLAKASTDKRTLDQVGGAFFPNGDPPRLIIGTIKGGSHSVGTHEMGHAIDKVLSLRTNARLAAQHQRLFESLPGYYQQGNTPGSGRGMSEFVAEAFGVYVDRGATIKPPWFDDELAAVIQQVIKEAGF